MQGRCLKTIESEDRHKVSNIGNAVCISHFSLMRKLEKKNECVCQIDTAYIETRVRVNTAKQLISPTTANSI